MKRKILDTNIIVRFFVEDNDNPKYQKVFKLFDDLETKTETAFLDNVVLIETHHVLTKVYKIPNADVVDNLMDFISFSGIEMENKNLMILVLHRLKKKKIDFVDAYLIELSLSKQMPIYTYDEDIIKSEAQTIPL